MSESKSQARARLAAARAALAPAARARASAAIATHADALLHTLAVRAVGLYAQRSAEVATDALWRRLATRAVRVYLPRCEPDRRTLAFVLTASPALLRPGHAGIREPEGAAARLDDLGALVVPCVGIAADGTRLGSGHGYYDRLLPDFRGVTLGLAFDATHVPTLPRAAHDRPLDWIVTERGVRRATGRGAA